MKILLFLSRVTFLYNICMLIAFVLHYRKFIPGGTVQSTILVSGIVLSVVFNTAVTGYAAMLLVKKPLNKLKPYWLFSFNFLCFIFQLYLLLK